VERVELDDGTIAARKVFDPSPQLGPLTPDEREKLARRFVREVRTQSELSKYGAMPVLASDLHSTPPWFTMPLAQKTLRAQIEEDRAAKRVSAEPLADILNALEQIHRLGFVHRDLKPENVLFHDGTWRLADFGLAVRPKDGETTRLTSSDATFMGTAAYCAPEQRTDFKRAGAAADIYAFGCILHDLLEGKARLPYQQHDGRPPHGTIIRKCTAVDPSKRFKSVSALRALLLSTLADAANIDVSAVTKEWAEALTDVGGWSLEKMEEFANFARSEKPVLGAMNDSMIFGKLNPEHLVVLHDKSKEVWSDIALGYCDWARGTFSFSFCDVVVDLLSKIFELGGLEEKAMAVTSAAVLGSSHHRFFVMGRVLAMCDRNMDSTTAERVAIEISAGELEHAFQICAEVMHHAIDDYHPMIAAAIRRAAETRRER
jgi:serine/threonine protein kinase